MIFFRKIVLEDGRARGGFWTVFGWQKFLYQYYYYLFFFSFNDDNFLLNG